MATDVKSLVLNQITEQTNEANKVAETIASATTDVGKFVHEVRQNSDLDWIVEYRAWLEKANAAIEAKTKQIDERIRAEVLPAQQADVNVDELKEKYAHLKEEITAARKYLKVLGVDEKAMESLPDLKTLRGGTTKAGAGTGGKRPRLSEVKVDGAPVFTEKRNDDGTVTQSASFTVTAQHLSKITKSKVTPKQLQEAAFEAAKTDDLSTLNGTPFDFYFSAGEGDNRKNFHIEVTPRDANAE